MSGNIVAIWSSFGHTFMGDGNGPDEYGSYREECLSCGAVFELRPDLERDPDGSYGKYEASDGDYPVECPGASAGWAHGYERVCQDNNGRECDLNAETGSCEHVDHKCNCVQCQ